MFYYSTAFAQRATQLMSCEDAINNHPASNQFADQARRNRVTRQPLEPRLPSSKCWAGQLPTVASTLSIDSMQLATRAACYVYCALCHGLLYYTVLNHTCYITIVSTVKCMHIICIIHVYVCIYIYIYIYIFVEYVAHVFGK